MQIKFAYQKYCEDEVVNRTAEPYALKELEITNKAFQFPIDFNVNNHYRHSFDIISLRGDTSDEVILSFDLTHGEIY